MSGVVTVAGNAGSLTGAALRGGDVVVHGRVGARTGIDQKGGTIIVGGDAGMMTGFMMQRGRMILCGNVGHGLGDSMYDGTIYVGGHGRLARHRLRPRRVDGRGHGVRRAQVPDPRARLAARAAEVRLRQEALQLRQPRALGTKAGPLMPSDEHVLGHSRIFTPEVINDIHVKAELGRYRMRGFSMFKPIPHWDELMFLPGTLDPLRDRGLPREVRDEDGARRSVREEPALPRHPDLHHRDELRRAFDRGEDGPREGRLDGGDGDLLGRGRDDPARARPLDEVVLPVHPEPVRVQPAPPDARRRLRVLHRPGLQGRARRPSHGAEGDRAGRGDALAAAGDRPALARAASRLARPRRPLAEDPGDPRGDRLPDPDPAQARRRPRLRRRAHGGEVRPRRDLPRRRRGRHRRGPAHRDRGDRESR